MKITVGKTAGFCFGVKRAVETAFQNSHKNICTFGPIIHNQFVINELKEKGVEVINNLEDTNNRTVIIRAHGVPMRVYSQIENMGINYIDCTCPFVKKIHNIVQKNYENGKKIIIIGNSKHPEVIGINGYVHDSAVIIKNIDDAKKFLNDKNFSYLLVAQTTFSHELFNEIISVIASDNIQICNTICNTTFERQKEAQMLSQASDKMVVIGDRSSSNTSKLFDICHKNCCNTFFIQNPTDLLLINFNTGDKIGIMAGASTPLTVIKEAVSIMNQTVSDEKSFEQLLNESFVTLRTGEIVKGEVIQITNNEVIVNLGYKSDGVISKENFCDANAPLMDLINIGDEIEAVILKIDDGEGNVILSKRKLDLQRGFKKLEKAFNENSIVNGKIVGIVKSGVIALVYNVKLFIPASHLSNSGVNDLNSYIGKTMDFKVIEFNRAKHRYVGSHKGVVSYQGLQENSLPKIKVGDEIMGTVTRIADFGIFVNIGEFSGLVHVSQMDLGNDKDFKNKFNIGDELKVFVIKVDDQCNRISLSMRNPKDNPWHNISQKYPEGKIVEGKVARINDYGAFVALEPSVDGLLHISQISNEHVAKVSDMLKAGDVVKLKVLSSDENKKRVSLSMIDVE